VDFSKEYNYVLVGPGCSGKSYIYNRYSNRTKKFNELKPDNPFFAEPSGKLSYLSPNASLALFVAKLLSCICPIMVIVCKCDMMVLRRRLTDRLYRRIRRRKYENNDYYRFHMEIFAKNYMYDYKYLLTCLDYSLIPYKVEDTTG